MSTARKFKKVGLRRALTEISTFHFACLRETPNGIDANAFCLGRNICDRSAYIQYATFEQNQVVPLTKLSVVY